MLCLILTADWSVWMLSCTGVCVLTSAFCAFVIVLTFLAAGLIFAPKINNIIRLTDQLHVWQVGQACNTSVRDQRKKQKRRVKYLLLRLGVARETYIPWDVWLFLLHVEILTFLSLFVFEGALGLAVPGKHDKFWKKNALQRHIISIILSCKLIIKLTATHWCSVLCNRWAA